jgi:ketosteroid isomerase-like protein
VPDENLKLVRVAYEALNRGDIEAVVDLCEPDFELDMSERVFNPATYEGHDGLRRFYREVREVWEEFRWEPEDLYGAGDRVVALLHSHGRGRGSGVEIDRHVGMVWTVREGRASALHFYLDPDEALKAAGLHDR